MQKPGTDVRKRILPQHVFQLQCIMDSFTVYRGWTISYWRGHVTEPPGPYACPEYEVVGFRDGFDEEKEESLPTAFGPSAKRFDELFLEQSLRMHLERVPFKKVIDGTPQLLRNLNAWLCTSNLDKTDGWSGMPPSRFAATNANGLWEYSPYLCAVGLVEALELVYKLGMIHW
jgi:hypothetical protein